MIKKRLIITSVISILLVAVLMLGSTYSIFTTSEIDENANVYTTGNLKVTYALGSGNVQITDSSPMTIEEANAVIPYRITVNNTGTVPYMFDVTLTDTTSSIDNTIDYQYIMTKVGYLEPKKLSNCANNVIKEDVIVPAGESVDIDVRVWLGANLSNSEMGKSFYGKLSIDGLAIYDDSTDINNDILSLRYMNTSSTNDFRNEAYLTNIKTASFVDYIDTTNASLDADNNPIQWDMSTAQDNGVIAWLEPSTEEGYYDLYIGCNDKIYANSLGSFFYGMTGLTDISFDNLDSSLTKGMPSMFSGCSSLTTLDLSIFNTSNVTGDWSSMPSMFSGCSSLISLDISNFDTSNVTRMDGMFKDCSSLTTLDLSNFDTSSVTSMIAMFSGCSSLILLDLNNFDVSNVTSMKQMFMKCSNLEQLNLSGFDTGKVTYMESMFNGCGSLIDLDISGFDTGKVTNMGEMFSGCGSLVSLDLSNFNTSNVTNMANMFLGCGNLVSIDVSNFNTSKVTNMQNIFGGCSSLTSLDLSSWVTSQVTSIYQMFLGCSSLEFLNLNGWDISNVTNMEKTFAGCSSLTFLDLSVFDTSSVINMNSLFNGSSKLTTTITIRNPNVTHYSMMFGGAANSNGAKITVNYTSATSTLVDNMIATKSSNSNVVKGNLVS